MRKSFLKLFLNVINIFPLHMYGRHGLQKKNPKSYQLLSPSEIDGFDETCINIWYYPHRVTITVRIYYDFYTVEKEIHKLSHTNLQLDTSGHDNGSEGKGMWTDGSDHDGGDAGMNHGGTGCYCIRCAPRWGGYDEA